METLDVIGKYGKHIPFFHLYCMPPTFRYEILENLRKQYDQEQKENPLANLDKLM